MKTKVNVLSRTLSIYEAKNLNIVLFTSDLKIKTWMEY